MSLRSLRAKLRKVAVSRPDAASAERRSQFVEIAVRFVFCLFAALCDRRLYIPAQRGELGRALPNATHAFSNHIASRTKSTADD
jgi:hypothetical protein